jgi:hypothetical protein
MSNKNNRNTQSRNTTTGAPLGKATGKTGNKKPRKTPMGQAIFAAEMSLQRCAFRKEHALKRADSLKLQIATIVKNASQYDSLLATLQENLQSLREMDKKISAMTLEV